MVKKGPLLAFLIFSVYAVPGFCNTPEELLGSDRAAALRSRAAGGELISEVQLRNPGFRLLPGHVELERFVGEAKADLGPAVLVETLFLYNKPQGRTEAWSEAERADLFNRVVALSTLAGIEYFSITRGAMRTFYESSHVIDNPRNRRPLPDPSFATPPGTLVLYAQQRDLTFGNNVYRFDYRTGADFMFFVQENITAMTAGIVPAIGRNRFRMVMAVIDAGDSLLIYAAAMARVSAVPGMGDRIGSSFNNRLKAVLQWFSEHADDVFR